MEVIDRQDPIAYVRALELALPPQPAGRLKPFTVQEGTEAGYVDAGSLVSFVAGVPELHKQDVLNSTLLAQLAANKVADREKKVKEWYAKYVEVLGKVGWVFQAFNFTEYSASGSTFTADKVIADVLEAIATKDDKKIIDATIKAVKALDGGDGRLMLWNQNSTKLTQGNFQISSCAESDGVVVMKLGAFYFSTDKNVTSVLWFSFSKSSTQMYKSAVTVNLNDQVYAKVRQAVLEKLGRSAQDYVGELDI